MAKAVIDGWKLPAIKIDPPSERYLKLIAGPETTGQQNASVLFSHIPPGSTTGVHTHPGSDEIMYVVGRGEGTVSGVKSKLETDSVIIAPRGVAHECRNTSETDTLRLFCVFIPPLKLSGPLAILAEETKLFLANQGP